jgi:hypothetical protein
MSDPLSARVFRFGECGYDRASGEVARLFLDDDAEVVERLVSRIHPGRLRPAGEGV